MNARERVLRTLDFKPVDRAPRQLWCLPWVGMFANDELKALLNDFPGDFTGPGGVLAQGDRSRGEKGRKGTYLDDWGSVWESAEDGVVGEVKEPPLSDWSALESYQPPWEIVDNANWDAANQAQELNLAGQPMFMLAGSGAQPFERMQFLRGSEALFMDMAYDTAEFRKLLDMVHEFGLKAVEGWARTDVDAISFSDDWGSQTSLLIAPEMWRHFFKPLYRQYCEIIRSSGKRVFMHSDGHISAIYEDLIEIGVDAVNSQLFCMDIEDIGRRFRGRITFWGEIDRQQVLPFGSVDDVTNAVARVRRALDHGSGGVIAQCEWGKNNPAENVRAVFDAWMEPVGNQAE
ncbi:MAG: uroporphyrinogen decarboxylase family protein [Planctomycetota bacterium]|nr:uroporphyrinogen decarboxylase family protein [Planctomycetota bacterium]MDP7250186.1 uroporphyrinogen decarboxylase family protein [Planctomycetota bacterium]